MLRKILEAREQYKFMRLMLNTMLNAFKNGESFEAPLADFSFHTRIKFFLNAAEEFEPVNQNGHWWRKIFHKKEPVVTCGPKFFKETCMLKVIPIDRRYHAKQYKLYFDIQGYTQVGLLRNETLNRYYYLMWKTLEDTVIKGPDDISEIEYLLKNAAYIQIKWAVNY